MLSINSVNIQYPFVLNRRHRLHAGRDEFASLRHGGLGIPRVVHINLHPGRELVVVQRRDSLVLLQVQRHPQTARGT